MNIAELTADPRNPRSIDAASASGLRYSLREFGDIGGIVFNRKLERLVCGHQRLEQLRAEHGDALKLEKPRKGAATGRIKCPNGDVFGVRFVDWDEPKSWAANIAANNPAIAGTFTDDLQGQLGELEQLNPEDFRELRLDELQDPTTPELVDAEAQLDRAEELREQWKVETGQLWEITGESGNVHRLMCGDSTKAEDVERLMGGAEPFIMVTDPPYGVEYDPGFRPDSVHGSTGKHLEVTRGTVINDDRSDWTETWGLSGASVAYVWHGALHSSVVEDSLKRSTYEIRNHIIWRKPQAPLSRGHYGWQHEPCWYSVKKGATAKWCGGNTATTVWEITGSSGWARAQSGEPKTGHPTQKPLECMARPIRNHGDKDDDVYDPFAGSSTTGIAAENLGRRSFLMEISPAYVAVGLQRFTDIGLTCELQG